MTSVYPDFNGASREPANGRAEAEVHGVRRDLEDAAKPCGCSHATASAAPVGRVAMARPRRRASPLGKDAI